MKWKWSALRTAIAVIGLAFLLGLGLAAFSYLRLPDPTQSTPVTPTSQATPTPGEPVSNKQADFWIEVAKASLQVALVGVVGAVVAATLKYLEQEWAETQKTRQDRRAEAQLIRQERRAADQKLTEYRRSMLVKLRSAYADLKSVRRQLRVEGFTRETSAPNPLDADKRGTYEAFMQRLNNAQLAIEDVHEALEAVPSGKWSAASLVCMKWMTKYMDQLIIEWQGSRRKNDVGELKVLLDFTDKAWYPEPDDNKHTHEQVAEGKFGPGIVVHFRVAMEALQKEIIEKSRILEGREDSVVNRGSE